MKTQETSLGNNVIGGSLPTPAQEAPSSSKTSKKPAENSGLLRLLKTLRPECDSFVIDGWGNLDSKLYSAVNSRLYNIVKGL